MEIMQFAGRQIGGGQRALKHFSDLITIAAPLPRHRREQIVKFKITSEDLYIGRRCQKVKRKQGSTNGKDRGKKL